MTFVDVLEYWCVVFRGEVCEVSKVREFDLCLYLGAYGVVIVFGSNPINVRFAQVFGM